MGDSVDGAWLIPAPLVEVRPDATALLETANVAAWETVPPTLLELVRLTVAGLIGNEEGLARRSVTARDQGLTEDTIALLGDYATSEMFSATERACLAFAEQFVIDVGGMPEEQVAGLQGLLGAEHVRPFVDALYATECTQRLEIVVPMLLGSVGPASHQVGSEAAATGGPDAAPPIREALKHYQDAVMRGHALDPVLTEMVRLRCARTHDCRICKTLRLADALDAGADDAMTAKIDRYELSDLDERTKVALRITDAFITRPDTLSDKVIREARATFSREELVELCLDITKWSTQKVHVSLGLDGAERLPLNEAGVSFFGFADDGGVSGYSEAPLRR